jgi:outer membrane lipoprotein-sorting protein
MRGTALRTAPAPILILILGIALGWPAAAQNLPSTAPLPRPAPLPKEGALTPLRAPQAIAPAAPAPAAQTVTPIWPPAAITNPPAAAPGRNSATAFDAAQRAAIERVNVYLNGMSFLVGDFVQVGPDGSRTNGNFYLQKPGKIRFEYNPPSPVELIANGSAVAVRDRKLATQDIYPLSQTPLRFLLAEKIDLLRDANVVNISQDELFISVVIEEKTAIAGTHRLMIMFGVQDNQLKQWTITDPQGYDTTIAIYNLDASRRPDPRLFVINFERMLQ